MSIFRKVKNKVYSLFLSKICPLFNRHLVIGNGFSCRGGLNLNINGGKIKIGNNVFINRNCSFNARETIEIGDGCLFGENVTIYDHNHIFSDLNLNISSQGFKSKKIVIGKNCWIATNVTILCGVKIGDNTVIVANCLIYKDVPANSVVKNGTQLIVEERLNKNE